MTGMLLGTERRRKNWSVDELARKLGMNREVIIDTELGLRLPGEVMPDVARLERVLGFKPGTIDESLEAERLGNWLASDQSSLL